jgi:hypothetical protein
MASKDIKALLLGDLRGGRNGGDSPFALPDNQCVEAVNVDWFEGNLGRKRGGSASVSLTFGSAGPFTGPINALFRHVPGADETAAELWAVDNASPIQFGRLAGGTSWAKVLPKDDVDSHPQDVQAASFNGKLFFAFNSDEDRLHVWDGTTLRRTGLAVPAAPTAANTGAGSYSATARRYRVRWTVQVGGITVRRSEAGAVVSFTPSGTGTAARVTMPTLADEGETHWELEAAPASGDFYRIATTAIGTTTYDDSGSPDSYNTTGTETDETGLYTNWPSVKYLLTDGNRLVGAGSWESGGKNSRVYFSPVLGSLDVSDDERVVQTTDQKNYIDINENDGGFITGLAGPLQGSIYAFKYRQIWKLVPTGDVSGPYLAFNISPRVGALTQKSIVDAQDYLGNPAIYFLSQRGPCRVGAEGLEYLGRDIEDIWSTVNLAATTTVGFSVYHAAKNQVWFWVATGASNSPNKILVFDIMLGNSVDGERVRGGWSQFTGEIAEANSAVMFSNTLGASMSRDLKPYIGQSKASATILKADTADLTDNGTAFRGYLRSRPYTPAGLSINFGFDEGYLVAKSSSGVSIRLSVIRDMGAETRTSDVLLTAAGSETYVLKKFEACDLSEAWCAQMEIGDASAVAGAWTLDGFTVPVPVQERR